MADSELVAFVAGLKRELSGYAYSGREINSVDGDIKINVLAEVFILTAAVLQIFFDFAFKCLFDWL